MGFRAAVAFETAEGEYDIYLSDDGAKDYFLRPILEKYVNGEITVEGILKLKEPSEDDRFLTWKICSRAL